MPKPNQRLRLSYKVLLATALSLLGLAVAFLLPLPYYITLPGGSAAIGEVLTVKKADQALEPVKGRYDYVAVGQLRATPASLLYAWLTPFTDVDTEKASLGHYSEEDYYRINQFYMETSQNQAIYQALQAAGEPVHLDYLGVYVLEVAEDSSFKGVLQLADTVTGVNGKTFANSKEMIDYVGGLALDQAVSITYLSDGEEMTAKGRIIQLENGRQGIGIGLVDHTTVASSVDVAFHLQNVGGPSAGLMFTLAIFDQLSQEDLARGRHIAGTGTIEMDAKVGNINGVDKKVVAAHWAGASIFFAPDNPPTDGDKSNYQIAKETAKKLGTSMTIVPVKTLEDALTYLRQ